jgi:hypothetical protein
MERISEMLPRTAEGGWDSIPKLFRMRQVADDIREFGMLAVGDTGPREAFGKGLKQGYTLTNKQPTILTSQICKTVMFKEAVGEMSRLQDAKKAKTTGGAVSSPRPARMGKGHPRGNQRMHLRGWYRHKRRMSSTTVAPTAVPSLTPPPNPYAPNSGSALPHPKQHH